MIASPDRHEPLPPVGEPEHDVPVDEDLEGRAIGEALGHRDDLDDVGVRATRLARALVGVEHGTRARTHEDDARLRLGGGAAAGDTRGEVPGVAVRIDAGGARRSLSEEARVGVGEHGDGDRARQLARDTRLARGGLAGAGVSVHRAHLVRSVSAREAPLHASGAREPGDAPRQGADLGLLEERGVEESGARRDVAHGALHHVEEDGARGDGAGELVGRRAARVASPHDDGPLPRVPRGPRVAVAGAGARLERDGVRELEGPTRA